MPRSLALAFLLTTAIPALAQAEEAGERHVVAAGNNWSITDSECLLDATWDGDVTIMVNLHGDHYDLGLYDRHMKGVVDQKVVPVRFGAADTIVSGRDYVALGHRNAEATAYVSDVDEDLLERIATANSFQFYRGKTLLANLDMTGFGEALATMRTCEAARSDGSTAEAATAAAAAAAAEVSGSDEQP